MKIKLWILDVNYEVVGNEPEIRLWGITSEGKRAVVKVRGFKPYFYAVPKANVSIEKAIGSLKPLISQYRILSIDRVQRKYYGKPIEVIKITCQLPPTVPQLREAVLKLKTIEDVLEADIRFYMRYLIDKDIYPCAWHEIEVERESIRGLSVDEVYRAISDPKYLSEMTRIPDLKVLAFDIECYNPRGTPKPQRDPVIVISVKTDSGKEEILTADDHNDRNLIRSFIDLVNSYDPDIIIGYNNNGFDWPYLLNRCKALHMKLNISRAGGSPAQSVYGHFSIVGRANVDLYDFAKDMPEVKVKTLENVAEYLGVLKKSERVLIEGSELYKYWDNPEKRKTLYDYARDDVKSIYGLGEKILPFAIQLSSIVGLPLDQVGAASVGFRVEWYLMKQAYKLGELIPNRVERPYTPYKGAIVLKPKPGLHENIVVLDFSAMYPNIMISKNISPDTYVPPYEEVSPDEVYVAPEVGHRFRKKPPGFYKQVLGKLLQVRNEIRKIMKTLDPHSYEYRVLYERQRALKVIANATYGYCGWIGARWYKREVAEATTAWGREIIKKTINMAKSLGLEVIYGDTDSIFVRYIEDKVKKLCELIEKEFGLRVKPDKIYIKVFFTEAKKRYCGLLPDGRIDVVGLEAIRGDWSELAKEVQEKVIEIVLKEGDPYKAVKYVSDTISALRNKKIPLSKLIIWKSVTKELDKYEVKTAHVAAARRLLEAGYRLEIGDKIGYVIVKRPGEKLADKAMPYILVKDIDEIDVDYYIKKQIIPAAMRILEYFGIKESQLEGATYQKSLLEFFG
ncbi:MAG: DNA polymerase II [Thermoprotei archaeon]|nr:MAG: DNA polymerase II [Thermoprotei archaeon]